MSTLRIAAVQHDIVWNDRDANFERLAPTISGAVASGAQLVLLTETFSTGFGFGSEGFETEPTGGASSQFLADQAKVHGVWVGGSCPEVHPDAPDDDQRPSNCFVLAGPEAVTSRAMLEAVMRSLDRDGRMLRLPLAPLMGAARVMEGVLRPLGVQPPLHPRRMDFFRRSFSFSLEEAKELGYQPRVGLDEGMQATAQWYLERGLIGTSG